MRSRASAMTLALLAVLTASAPAAAGGTLGDFQAAHLLPGAAAVPFGGTVPSGNWSGYVVTAAPQSLHQVSATWVLPSVSCFRTNDDSAFWVGLNGFTDQSQVEQTGVDANCSSGRPVYRAWYERVPSPPVYYSNPVGPGDTLTATVDHDNAGGYTAVLTDVTRGWSHTTALSGAADEDAEVIAEAPGGYMAPFGQVTFTNTTVNGVAMGTLDPTQVYIPSSTFFNVGSPGAFDAAGDSFPIYSTTDH